MLIRIVAGVVAAVAIAGIVMLAVSLGGARSDIDRLRDDRAQLSAELTKANETVSGLSSDLTTANGEIDSLTLSLGQTERQLDAAESEIEVLTADKGTLELELVADRETMAGLRQDKTDLESSLTTANGKIDSLTSSLGRTERQLDAAEKDINVLVADKAELESDLAAHRETIGDLQQYKAALESSLSTLTAENLNLTNERNTLTADLESANAARSRLTSDLQDARGANAALRAENEAIVRMHGRVENLRQEIDDLELRRSPLILETHRQGFLCTGSMEPKLTCLDEATMLTNFRPEDIVVGSVISFKPTDECNLESDAVTHRVMEIKVEDGVHYYWPKGDANSEPDGCWIPDSNVLDYMIEVHKDARPENAELRQDVLDAFARWDEGKVKYDEAWAGVQRLL